MNPTTPNRLSFFTPESQAIADSTIGKSPCAWCLSELGIAPRPEDSHTICYRHKRAMFLELRDDLSTRMAPTRMPPFRTCEHCDSILSTSHQQCTQCGLMRGDTAGGAARETLGLAVVLVAAGIVAILAIVVL